MHKRDKLFDNLRLMILELISLYRLWITENFTADEAAELFKHDLDDELVRKAFLYIASKQGTWLNARQAFNLLEITQTYLVERFTLREILTFFDYPEDTRGLPERVWSKIWKKCRMCGGTVCRHKAKGLCLLCYRKVWLEKCKSI